jgi:anthranilate synthase/aminodeoxychorismate synthase-like glutamine amidotransferase
MLLMIDNYDSFTYNLVQYFLELGETVEVWRHDQIDIAGIYERKPDQICISPGPGNPKTAGISLAVIEHFMPKLPLLGVCLGHQSIAESLGATIASAKAIMHGKTSEMTHDGTGLFQDLPKSFTVARYHSLAIQEKTLPPELIVNARTDDGEIMAITHHKYPCLGVQFHPEAILTEHGHAMLANFLKIAKASQGNYHLP